MSYESARKRLDAATPGPWERITNTAWDDQGYIKARAQHGMRHVAYVRSDEGDPVPNADFIAHAPTDLALLLDVAKAAHAQARWDPDHVLDELRTALDALKAAP